MAEASHFDNQHWGNEFMLNALVIGCWMMFGPAISIVEFTGALVDAIVIGILCHRASGRACR
jgi:hypothetical protein